MARHPDQWIIWCGLNSEAHALALAIGQDAVNIEGADSEDQRAFKYARWKSGAARVLVTKPSIFGFGMNWQSCHQMMFFGLGDSWEQYYQAIRRCWRFGQKHPVTAWIVTSDAESHIVHNVKRKEADAERTAQSVIERMKDLETHTVRDEESSMEIYNMDTTSGDGWTMMLGDSCERMKEIGNESTLWHPTRGRGRRPDDLRLHPQMLAPARAATATGVAVAYHPGVPSPFTVLL